MAIEVVIDPVDPYFLNTLISVLLAAQSRAAIFGRSLGKSCPYLLEPI
jgi:hypothetical protein